MKHRRIPFVDGTVYVNLDKITTKNEFYKELMLSFENIMSKQTFSIIYKL